MTNATTRMRADLAALLRQFAKRTAQAHREDLYAVYPQLRTINRLVREILGGQGGTMKRDVRVCMKADPDDRKITCG